MVPPPELIGWANYGGVMTKAKGRVRQSRGLVTMEETAPQDRFLDQFPFEEQDDEEVRFDLGDDGRCIQKFVNWRGQVIWFSIVTQIRYRGDWHTVARADTCHDEAHIHRFQRGSADEISRHVLCEISSIDDVAQGFDDAVELLIDEFEENVRRWNR